MNKELIAYAERLVGKWPIEMRPIEDYKEIHANFSGGKDSVAFVLMLVYGYKIPISKIKLVHMRIDGLDTDSTKTFFDYPETDDYLRYCSEKLGIPLTIIGSEMGLKERILSRGRFPAANTQYCTSYNKRDVYSKWVRTLGPGNFLCCTGERAQESSRRKNKAVFEIYKAANAPTKKRNVHWYRPIHHLLEEEVWQLMNLAGIDPHPCYTSYGVSRCSCKFCIFLSPKEMKKISECFPEQFKELEEMEQRLGHTMKYSKDKGAITLKQFIADADKDEQICLDIFKPCFSWD